MTNDIKQLIAIYELLPLSDKELLLNLAKKLSAAYDPDYIKLLPNEKKELNEAIEDIKKGINICDESDVNW